MPTLILNLQIPKMNVLTYLYLKYIRIDTQSKLSFVKKSGIFLASNELQKFMMVISFFEDETKFEIILSEIKPPLTDMRVAHILFWYLLE